MAVVALEANVQAVGEVAGPAQLLQEIHAVAPTAEAAPHPGSSPTVHVLGALHPALALARLLARHPEGLVHDVDEGPLHDGQHLEMSGDHDSTWLVSVSGEMVNEVSAG